MENQNSILLDKLNNPDKYPCFLFMGQNYLSLGNEKNLLIEKLKKDFNLDNSINDYSVLKSIKQEDKKNLWTKLLSLSEKYPIPEWLRTISNFPWASVYTTTFDTLFNRIFTNNWRKIQVEYKLREVTDKLSKTNLHSYYLYSRADLDELPPLDDIGFFHRKGSINAFLKNLCNDITPFGTLIIEGYDDNDFLNFEKFFENVNNLIDYQIHYFSFPKELEQNFYIQDLKQTNKIILHNESLSEFFSNNINVGNLKINIEFTVGNIKYIKIGNQQKILPDDIYRKLSPVKIIDNNTFITNFSINKDKNSQFAEFIGTTGKHPQWYGYRDGFVFKRDYFDNFIKKIKELTANKRGIEKPLIFWGQTCTSKTLMLGMLAYELQEKATNANPILFIDYQTKKLNLSELINFCRYIDDNSSEDIYTLIIWDALGDEDKYYQLQKELHSKGLKVLVIGTVYNITENQNTKYKNYFKADILFDKKEKENFLKFIQQFNQYYRNIFSEKLNKSNDNFLDFLYVNIRQTANAIKLGLENEIEESINKIRDNIKKLENEKISNLALKLFELGFAPETDEILKWDFSDEINVVFDTIMVVGEYNLKIPFTLLSNLLQIDLNASYKIINLFQKENIVDITEEDNDIVVGARTRSEAKIITNKLSFEQKVNIIINLIDNVRNTKSHIIFFIFQILENTVNKEEFDTKSSPYAKYAYLFADVLKKIRTEYNLPDFNLLLSESKILRKILGYNWLNREKYSWDDVIEITQKAIEEIENKKDNSTLSKLYVELATALSYKNSSSENTQQLKEDFFECQEKLKKAMFLRKNNLHALDVIAWTTRNIVENNKNKNIFQGVELIEIYKDVNSIFDKLEFEKNNIINFENYEEKFYGRKLEVANVFNDNKKFKKILKETINKNLTAGYYIEAKLKLPKNEREWNDQFIKNYLEVYNYYKNIEDKIKADKECLFLYLKSWWIVKYNKPMFDKEEDIIKFDDYELNKYEDLLDKLIKLKEKNDDKFGLIKLYYLYAVLRFHRNYFGDSEYYFNKINNEIGEHHTYGAKNDFIYSENEKFKIKQGQVIQNTLNDLMGIIQCNIKGELVKIKFPNRKFGTIKLNDTVDFYIGFNIKGAIAIPPNIIDKKKQNGK